MPTAQVTDSLTQSSSTSWPATEPAINRGTVPREITGSSPVMTHWGQYQWGNSFGRWYYANRGID
jgi:hypothetical protein